MVKSEDVYRRRVATFFEVLESNPERIIWGARDLIIAINARITLKRDKVSFRCGLWRQVFIHQRKYKSFRRNAGCRMGQEYVFVLTWGKVYKKNVPKYTNIII